MLKDAFIPTVKWQHVSRSRSQLETDKTSCEWKNKSNSRSGPSFSTAPRGHQRTESAVMTTNLLTCESTTVMEDDSWFWSRPSSSFQCFKLLIVIFKFHVSTERNVWTGEDQISNKNREYAISNENIMRIFYKTKGEILNKLFDHQSGQTADWLQMFLSSVRCNANVTSLVRMWLIAGMLTTN